MNKLIPLLMIVVWGGSTAAQQPAIPTDLTFRPKTFARPSRAHPEFPLRQRLLPSSHLRLVSDELLPNAIVKPVFLQLVMVLQFVIITRGCRSIHLLRFRDR